VVRLKARRGAFIALLGVTIVALIAVASVALDFSRLWTLRNELQSSADAGAHAGAIQLLPPNAGADADDSASSFATKNKAMGSLVTVDSAVLGHWNDVAKSFTSATMGGSPIDAVSVFVSRQSNGLFMALLGVNAPRLRARAIGWAVPAAGSHSFSRFLVDNEMFDPGMQWLKDLAQNMGTTSDQLLSDGNGDWFVDLPAGLKVQVPTGQVGDEALFDITDPAFPFTPSSNPSFEDFLNFNEDGSWRYGLLPIWMLDPLPGVFKVDDPSLYPNYLSPSNCQVSPLYKSDLSVVNVPPNSVNAKGERRGLVAFTVDSIGSDPDGPYGSKLPNLWMTICSASSIIAAGLDAVTIGLNAVPQKPIIVR